MRKQVKSLKKSISCHLIYTTILLISGMALSFNCSAQEKHQPTGQNFSNSSIDMTKLKKEIVTANNHLVQAVLKEDAIAAANCYAADARFMAPNESTATTRKAIQAEFSAIYKSGATKLRLTTIELWGNNDMLTEEGVFTFASKDGHPLDKGKYLVVWKKEHKSWKIFRDCFNSDLPSPPAN